MPSCRLLPHGAYSLLPAGFATIAWLCSLSQDGCDYSKLEGPIVQKITNSEIIPFLEIGFVGYREPAYYAEDDSWRVIYTGTCSLFDDASIQDSYWIAGKALAFVALVLGGAGALFLWFSTCFVFSRGTWRWSGYQVMLAFICQCLAFLWFATAICNDNSCSLLFGANTDICASVFYFIASVLILVRYPTPLPKEDREVAVGSPQVGLTERNDVPLEGDASAVLPSTPEPTSNTLVDAEIL